MPSNLYDTEYWLVRAEETRSLAELMSNSDTKRIMLSIARSYDEIAELSRKQVEVKKLFNLQDNLTPDRRAIPRA